MRTRFRGILVFASLIGGIPSQGQAVKNLETQQLGWFAYLGQVKLSEHWSGVIDLQERAFTDPLAQHQLLVRAHALRKLGNGWSAGPGLCHFLQWPNDPEALDRSSFPELRPYADAMSVVNAGKLRVIHRYRAEARFFRVSEEGSFGDRYPFGSFRFRYQLAFELPVFSKREDGTLTERTFLRFVDEVMVNAGSKVVNNTFDQNRLYGGVSHWFSPRFGLELGYQYWISQRPSGQDYFSRHIIRLALNHRFDLSKKQDPVAP